MKTQLLAITVIAASAVAPALAAAQAARAPELPDLSQFRERLHDVAVPEVVAPRAAPAAAKVLGCPVLDLQGATLSRAGIFTDTFDVKLGGKTYGAISSEGDGYTYRDAYGNIAAKTTVTTAKWGTKSEVTDCAGKKIGSIQEEITSDYSNFTISDAAGTPLANTGWTDSSSVSLKTGAGESIAKIEKPHWYSDSYTLRLTAKADPRVAAIVAVMNNSAGYRRSRERRRDREPHGGKFDR